MPLKSWEVKSPELALLLYDVQELIAQVEIKTSATLEKQHAAKTRALERAHEDEVRHLEIRLRTSKTLHDAVQTKAAKEAAQLRAKIGQLEQQYVVLRDTAANEIDKLRAETEAAQAAHEAQVRVLKNSHQAEIERNELDYKFSQITAPNEINNLQAKLEALQSSHQAEIGKKEMQYETLQTKAAMDEYSMQTKMNALEAGHQAELERVKRQITHREEKIQADLETSENRYQERLDACEKRCDARLEECERRCKASHHVEIEQMKQEQRHREEELCTKLKRCEMQYKEQLLACERRAHARPEECNRQCKAAHQADIERLGQEQRHREEELKTKLELCEMEYKDQLFACEKRSFDKLEECEKRGYDKLEECERQWKNSSAKVEAAMERVQKALEAQLFAKTEELEQLKGLRAEQPRTERRSSKLRTKTSKLEVIIELDEENQAKNPDPEESRGAAVEQNNIDVSNESIELPKAEAQVSKEPIQVEVEQNSTKARFETPYDEGHKEPTFETSNVVPEGTEVADVDETPETQNAEAKKQDSVKVEEEQEKEKSSGENESANDASKEKNGESTSKTEQAEHKGEESTRDHVDRCDQCNQPFGDEEKQWLSWRLCGHCYPGFTVELSTHYAQWAKDVQAMRESRSFVAFPYIPAGSARCHRHECGAEKQQRDGLRACIHDLQNLVRSSPGYWAKSRVDRQKWLKTQCRQWHPDQCNKMFGRWEKQDGTDLGDAAQSWDRNFTAMFMIFSNLVELEAGSNQQQSTWPFMDTATDQGPDCTPQ